MKKSNVYHAEFIGRGKGKPKELVITVIDGETGEVRPYYSSGVIRTLDKVYHKLFKRKQGLDNS